MSSDTKTECEIQAKGLTAPRVTPADLEANIHRKAFWQPFGTTLTVCVIQTVNGFCVVGESACASPENFDDALGKRLAFENARNKLWPLMGYALREKLVAEKLAADREANDPLGR